MLLSVYIVTMTFDLQSQIWINFFSPHSFGCLLIKFHENPKMCFFEFICKWYCDLQNDLGTTRCQLVFIILLTGVNLFAPSIYSYLMLIEYLFNTISIIFQHNWPNSSSFNVTYSCAEILIFTVFEEKSQNFIIFMSLPDT